MNRVGLNIMLALKPLFINETQIMAASKIPNNGCLGVYNFNMIAKNKN